MLNLLSAYSQLIEISPTRTLHSISMLLHVPTIRAAYFLTFGPKYLHYGAAVTCATHLLEYRQEMGLHVYVCRMYREDATRRRRVMGDVRPPSWACHAFGTLTQIGKRTPWHSRQGEEGET